MGERDRWLPVFLASKFNLLCVSVPPWPKQQGSAGVSPSRRAGFQAGLTRLSEAPDGITAAGCLQTLYAALGKQRSDQRSGAPRFTAQLRLDGVSPHQSGPQKYSLLHAGAFLEPVPIGRRRGDEAPTCAALNGWPVRVGHRPAMGLNMAIGEVQVG